MRNRDERWPGEGSKNQWQPEEGRYDITPRAETDRYANRERIQDRYRSDHDMKITRSRYDQDPSFRNTESDWRASRSSNETGGREYGENTNNYYGYSQQDRERDYEYDRNFSSRDSAYRSNTRPYGQAGMYGGGQQSRYAKRNAYRSEPTSNSRPEEHGVMDDIKSFFGFGPKNYKRSDDRIREDICDVFTYDHDLDASHIDVSVKDAVVTLTGTVPQRSAKRIAEDLAEGVRGVSDIRNEIQVRNVLQDEYSPAAPSSTPSTSASQSKKDRLI